jgi:hypothetical protein
MHNRQTCHRSFEKYKTNSLASKHAIGSYKECIPGWFYSDSRFKDGFSYVALKAPMYYHHLVIGVQRCDELRSARNPAQDLIMHMQRRFD